MPAVAIPNHRHALDAVRGEQTRYFADLRVLADGNDRRRHDVARGTFRRAQAREKLGIELFAICGKQDSKSEGRQKRKARDAKKR